MKRKITNIINLVAESEISIDTVKESLQKLEEDKIFCESQIASISDTVKMSEISESMINVLIEKSRESVRARNISECSKFVENYIERVLVFSDRVTVTFKINVIDSDGSQDADPLTCEESIKTLQREYKTLNNSD